MASSLHLKRAFNFYQVKPENEMSYSGEAEDAHPQIALRQFKTSSPLLREFVSTAALGNKEDAGPDQTDSSSGCRWQFRRQRGVHPFIPPYTRASLPSSRWVCPLLTQITDGPTASLPFSPKIPTITRFIHSGCDQKSIPVACFVELRRTVKHTLGGLLGWQTWCQRWFPACFFFFSVWWVKALRVHRLERS